MKKILSLLLAVLLVNPSELWSQGREVKVTSKITDVTVFLNGAQVTREASVSISSGVSNLVFENLPQGINSNSIQATAAGGATIMSVVYQVNHLRNQTKSPRILSLEDSLDILTEKLDRIANTRFVLEQEKSLLLTNKSIGGQNNGVSIEELEDALFIYHDKLPKIMDSLHVINQNKKAIEKRARAIRAQLQEFQEKRNRPSHEVIVAVKTGAPNKIKVNLNYYISGASWTPFYDLRAKDTQSPIQMSYKASVRQSTGEDWRSAHLILSTGNPVLGGTQPTLAPWKLSFKAHVEGFIIDGSSVSNNAFRSNGIDQDADGVKDALDIPELTNMTTNNLSADFDISVPMDVPADGKDHNVDIQVFNLKAEYSHLVIPKLDRDAFLIAKITGWENLNLLPGKANIFFNGQFVGESTINTRNITKTLDLSLGRDKQLVVTRSRLKDFSSKSLTGSQIKEAVAWEISVKNTKSTPVTIEVVDQLPISTDKAIEVKMEDIGGATYGKDSGRLTWKLEIAPRQTETVKFIYEVKYPKDQNINHY